MVAQEKNTEDLLNNDSRYMKEMVYQIKCVPSAYKSLAAPTYSNSSARDLIKSYGGTMSLLQVCNFFFFYHTQFSYSISYIS